MVEEGIQIVIKRVKIPKWNKNKINDHITLVVIILTCL